MTEAQQPCETLPVLRPLAWSHDIHLTSAAPSISVWQPHLSTQPQQQPNACYGCMLMGAVLKGAAGLVLQGAVQPGAGAADCLLRLPVHGCCDKKAAGVALQGTVQPRSGAADCFLRLRVDGCCI